MKPLLGLLFSIVGGLVVGPLLGILRGSMELGAKPEPERNRVPAWLTGVVERGFFTLMVYYDVSGTGTAMVGWLALKFATNWNFQASAEADTRGFAFSALVAGLVSMLFALLGGQVAKGRFW
jgi:hypothetical protein